MKARNHAATAAVRGDIGSSLVETRIIQTRLMLVSSILQGNNELVKKSLENIRKDSQNPWNKKLNIYLQETDIKYEDIPEMSKNAIKKKIREMDNKKWMEELETKTSLAMYKKHKTEIKEELIYDNRLATKIWFGSRTNTLEINIENRHREEKSTKCDLCEKEDETTIHFILECEKLDDKRNKELIRKYTQTEKEDTLAKILFSKDDTEEIKYMLENMWRKRTRIKRNNEEKEKEILEIRKSKESSKE